MKSFLVLTTTLFVLLSAAMIFAQGSGTLVMQTQWTADYLKFRDDACNSFQEKSDRMDAEFKLSDYGHWDFRQDTGQLVFSAKGVKKVVATVQIAGDITARNSWMWGWDNDSIDPALKNKMTKVRDLGKKKNFYELVTPEFTIVPDYAWTLTAVAGHVIGAKGAYRGQNGNGYIYFLITDIKWIT